MSKNLPPIQAWFVPRVVPLGAAPEHIKEDWVDVPLPLRQMGPEEGPTTTIGHGIHSLLDVQIIDNPMHVFVADAVKSLELFGRDNAADFWDCMLDPDQTLMFRGAEGQVYPTPIIQRILPGIELFDQTDL